MRVTGSLYGYRMVAGGRSWHPRFGYAPPPITDGRDAQRVPFTHVVTDAADGNAVVPQLTPAFDGFPLY